MKDLETDGVVEILPVDLADLLVVARHLGIGLCVFHLNLQIISCYAPTLPKIEDQGDGLETLVLLLPYWLVKPRFKLSVLRRRPYFFGLSS